MCFDVMVRMSTVATGLQRVLAVVERRGFSIVGVHAINDSPGTTSIRLRIDPGERSVSALMRQLEKLFDVRGVELAGPAPRRERGLHV